ncbi:hypothetical protein RHMOL_Rhmol12G0237900 [Rhododendron molle]|uniref:Uncharacterized protein n=1 Tax=Rhododendron molle TaxID=49168 RepID=A0ACC0LMJ3_RHOML|nr:hypothetical protein RHMOL_Rhmol12G0237900 [Rhododendron molle]
MQEGTFKVLPGKVSIFYNSIKGDKHRRSSQERKYPFQKANDQGIKELCRWIRQMQILHSNSKAHYIKENFKGLIVILVFSKQ